MKRFFWVVFLGIAIFICWFIRKGHPGTMMKITSPLFAENQLIPAQFTCDGENSNPPLSVSDVPERAQSLALIMDDPDAPVGIWDHWIKWNIPTDNTTIQTGVEPAGVSGKGSGGNLVYKGPCPPSGTHHYHFKVYALDRMLDIAEGSTKKELEQAMEGHIIEQAELIGLYKRANQ